MAVPPIEDRKAFLATLKDLVRRHPFYRIKGFLDVPGKPMRLALQGVGERFDAYFDRPWREGESRQGHLILIGQGLEDAGVEKELSGLVSGAACIA